MNCRKAQRRMLLAEAGELSQSGMRRLDRHAGRCPQCRAHGQRNRIFLHRAARALPAAEPEPAALQAVRCRLREPAQGAATAPRFSRPRLVAVGLAAAALVLLAAWPLWRAPDPQRLRAQQMHALVSLIEEPGPASAADWPAAGALDALGLKLLESQGLWVHNDTMDMVYP